MSSRGGSLWSTAGRSASPISAACRARSGVRISAFSTISSSTPTRAKGIGRALIEAVALTARERGWSLVRWVTADDNYRARALYDRLAVKTTWNLYELAV
ncbi:MAG: GNAT family N-acetyltransferase [Geminicoccaceae bacterium]